MITAEFASAFARDWVQAWNDHDLDAILSHYADSIVFHSPRIRLVTGMDVDSLAGRPALAQYWRKALDGARDLFFAIDQVFIGSDCLTIGYTNHRAQAVAETFLFNAQGMVIESFAAYA